MDTTDDVQLDELDPIDAAIADVNRQFADPNREPDERDDDTDLSDEDELPSDDEQDDDGGDGDEGDDQDTLSWEDPSSPYHPQYLEAQRNAEAAQRAEMDRERARQLVANIRTAQENAEVRQLITDLDEIDPEVSTKVKGVIGRHINEANGFRHESLGVQHGLAALHMALVAELGPEAAEKVVNRGRELASAPSLQHMQQLAQAKQGDTEEVAKLKKQLQIATLQIAAKEKKGKRAPVDSNTPPPRRKQKAEDADSFDDFYKNWEGNPFR